MINLTDEQIKQKLEKCIIETNRIILKKLDINSKIEISDATIKSLFNGYLNKYFEIHHIDFKRLVRLIDCHKNNKLLFQVTTNTYLYQDIYFKNRVLIKSILDILPTIKCSELNITEYVDTIDLNNLNFNQIIQIKF